MIGLTTSGPSSAASARAVADHGRHTGSPTTRSSSTHESTRVVGLRLPPTTRSPLLATQQLHQLVRRHPLDVLRRRRARQPPCQSLTVAARPDHPDDTQRAALLNHVDLVPLMQGVLLPQLGRDRELPLGIQLHSALLLRSTPST